MSAEPSNHRIDPVPARVLRHLATRVGLMQHRFERFLQQGWDINGLASMHEDSQLLQTVAVHHGLSELSPALAEVEQLLSTIVQQQALPDPALTEHLQRGLQLLREATPEAPEAPAPLPTRSEAEQVRAEVPPEHYWERWSSIEIPPVPVSDEAAPVNDDSSDDEDQAYDPWGSGAQLYGRREEKPAEEKKPAETPTTIPAMRKLSGSFAPITTIRQAPAPAEKPTAAPAPVAALAGFKVPEGSRLYHLTDAGKLSLELDQRLESQGFELEVLDDVGELRELLGAIPPDLLLVDAGFSGDLEAIGVAVREARARSSKKVVLVALAEADDIALRLNARRAGTDALIVNPHSVQDVMSRLQQLLDPQQEAPYRVLIVEDDRSQALFAEGILRNAGMESQVVLDALEVMDAMEQFQPDMVLMDLHMPAADGIEITALIREREAFTHTPIVFLSGESDQDKQFDALDAGGDDFLSKPIRPRHLIASVQNRVRRHRAVAQRAPAALARDPESGLYNRSATLQKINEVLSTPAPRKGGALYLDIEAASVLRDRLGLSAFETMLGAVGKRLAENAPGDWVCRFGDSSFLLLNFDRDDAGLEAQAAAVRGGLMQQSFDHQGHALRLRACVGVTGFSHPFSDYGQLLTAVERVCREARTSDRGVRRYEPPKSTHAERESKLLSAIGQAVSNRKLELLYQPIVAVAGGEESQFQVLLRLRDADDKLVSAGEIIPMAERGDFIVDIDRWVMMQAIGVIRDRQHGEKPLRLFVTQSPLTLADPSQAQWLSSELQTQDVPGTSVVIELRLEDAAMHSGTVKKFCDELTAAGVQFCLSQFEAGRDADSLLEQLPLGYVKLSRKYTSGNATGAVRDELKTLIERAHRRGLEVIGSAVEDPQAAATLWMSGIDFIQGNLVQEADRGLDFDFQQAVL